MNRSRRPLVVMPNKPPAKPARNTVEIRKRNRVILKSCLATTATVDALLGLLLIYLLFLHLPYFNLQQVEVTGNHRLSKAEVIETAEIESGTNLLTVDLAAIGVRLRRNPWVRAASVYRRFPGQLILEIDERSPRAILAASKLYYVDEQAKAFTRVLPGDPVQYPLFTGVTCEELSTNGPEIQDMIRQGLGLLDLLARGYSGLDPSAIAEIRLNLDEGLSLQTTSGKMIVLGKTDFEVKLDRYKELKTFLTQRGEWHNALIINLDFEDRAMVRSSDKAHLQG
jgi:cell division protein FtsQ